MKSSAVSYKQPFPATNHLERGLGDLCAGVFTDVLICDSLNLNNGLRDAMSLRRIGQEKFGFAVDRGQHSSLDELAGLIDWAPVDQALGVISCSA